MSKEMHVSIESGGSEKSKKKITDTGSKMKRIILLLIAFAFLISVLWSIDRVLCIKNKDGASSMMSFYHQPENTVDVLLMGTSHTGVNLNAETLWTEYGISSYALWGPSQPFWNTYYYLKEALKTQHPKVIVLDMYASKMQDEYLAELYQVSNIVGMHRNLNRIKAIIETGTPDQWVNLLLGYPFYHSRYAELNQHDFEYFPWSNERTADKGTTVQYGIYPRPNELDLQYISEQGTLPMLEKEKKWFTEIVDLARENDIPILLIKTPVSDRGDSGPYYRGAAEEAEEMGISFIDFNKIDDVTGITANDYWTDRYHLNTNGTRKITRYLGEYLLQHYELQDHRGDERYKSWDEFSRETQNQYISLITGTEDYLAELQYAKRTFLLFQHADGRLSEDLAVSLLDAADTGEEHNLSVEKGMYIVSEGTRGMQFVPFTEGYLEYSLNGKSIAASFDHGTGIDINGQTVYQYRLMEPTIVAIVYDEKKEEIVDLISFREGNGYHLERVK